MTNSLHRYGNAESFKDDYVVFAICCRGKNDQGSLPKLKKFLELALPFQPVNLGDARHGGALRSSRSLGPSAHWNRDSKPGLWNTRSNTMLPRSCAVEWMPTGTLGYSTAP